MEKLGVGVRLPPPAGIVPHTNVPASPTPSQLICASSLMAETVTHPLDIVKTRRQVMKTNMSFLAASQQILKTEGIMGFYPSIVPAVMRHWCYTTMRIALYERLRSADDNMAKKALAGLTAGGVAQALANPTDLLKVRMQVASLNAVKGGGSARNPFTGVATLAKTMYREGGLLAFYGGWRPNVLRAMTVNMGELASYDIGKRYLIDKMDRPDNMWTHLMASIHSGFWAALLSTPADVLKSRVMSGEYSSMVACLKDTVGKEGVLTLWRGFSLNWIRLAPWQLTFWITYEQLRLRTGLGGFK